jgi:hypothetical protein
MLAARPLDCRITSWADDGMIRDDLHALRDVLR